MTGVRLGVEMHDGCKVGSEKASNVIQTLVRVCVWREVQKGQKSLVYTNFF